MLTFKIITSIFIVVLIIQVLLSFYYGIGLLLIVIPFVIYISFLVYGSAKIKSDFYLNSYSSKQTKQNILALTFDDGPDANNTTTILDILAKYKIQACFFVIGEKVKINPEILKRIDAENHLIGNHSYSHSNYFSLYSSKKMLSELKETEEEVFKITGKKLKLFRPPFGVTNPTIKKAVSQLGYKVIGWNIRSFDTVRKNRTKLMKRLQKQIKPGSIILFHDTCLDIGDYLTEFLNYISYTNYEFSRLDQLLQIDAYE